MLRSLAVNATQIAKATIGKIIAVNGNGTYRVEIRGKVYDQIESLSGRLYRVGETTEMIFSFGQIYLP